MAHELPAGFIPKYFDEVKILAQQKRRKLEGFADTRGRIIGDDAHFPRIGQAEMHDASRLQELLQTQLPIDWVKVSADPKFVTFTMWDPDRSKLTIDMAGQFAQASIRAYNREKDRQHVAALAKAATSGVTNTKGVTENIVTIGDYNTAMDLELVADAIVRLGTDELFEGEEIKVVAPFKLRVQNALDPYFAKQGELKGNRPWDDLTWASYEKLPGNGPNGEGWLAGGATGVDIFVHAKSALAEIENDDMTEINERLGSRLGDMVGCWFQSATAATEAKGIIRIKSKLDFALLRPPVPTKERV